MNQLQPLRRRYIYLVRRPVSNGGDYWTWRDAGRYTEQEAQVIEERTAELARALSASTE